MNTQFTERRLIKMNTKMFAMFGIATLLTLSLVLAGTSYDLSAYGGNVNYIKNYNSLSSTSASAYVSIYDKLSLSSGSVLAKGKNNGKDVIVEVQFNVKSVKTVGKVTTITGTGYGSIQENNKLKSINNEKITVTYNSQTKKSDITGTGDVKFKVSSMPTTKN